MRYEIRIVGHLGDNWADWFGDLVLVREGGGATLLTCSVADQAALFGILRKVRDLGVTLQSVERVEDRTI